MILSDTDTLMYSCGSTVEYHRLVGKPNKPGMGIERERRLGVMIFIWNYLDIWSDGAI